MPSSRGSSKPRDQTGVSCTAGRFFTNWTTIPLAFPICCFLLLLSIVHWGRASCLLFGVLVLVAQSCPTLWDPMDCSPPGSSIHGIFQARVLEWVAISFFRESYWPRDQTQVSCIAGRFFTSWATREALFWNSVFNWMYLSLFPLLFTSLLFSTICKASSDNHFAVLLFFFFGMVLFATS